MSGGSLLLSRVMKIEIQIPDVSGKPDNDHRFCASESVVQPLVLCFAFKTDIHVFKHTTLAIGPRSKGSIFISMCSHLRQRFGHHLHAMRILKVPRISSGI